MRRALVPISRASYFVAENANESHHHAYKNAKLYPWKSSDDFQLHLQRSIVFQSEDLVIIDKPYGVPSQQSSAKTLTCGWLPEQHAPFNIHDYLPSLSKYLGVPSLEIIQRTERFSSGLLMLGTCREAVARIKKAIRRTKNMGTRPFTYRMLTCGIPHPLAREGYVGLEMIENESGKHSVVKVNYSNNEVKSNFVKKVSAKYRVLEQNRLCKTALVDMEVTTNEWNFVRVYSAFNSAAILGDDVCASRTKYVFGKPVHVSVHNAASRDQAILETQVNAALNLPRKDLSTIPAHIHLLKLALVDEKRKTVTYTVSPPNHFKWSCQKFGLECEH